MSNRRVEHPLHSRPRFCQLGLVVLTAIAALALPLRGMSRGQIGPEFQVNTYTSMSQNVPAVSTDGAGGFVVVWESYGSSGTDTDLSSIQGQRFDSAGTPLGTEFQVNTYTTGVQRGADVGADGAGGFVVVWGSAGSSGTDTYLTSIQGQRYDSAGAPLGTEFQVNAFTTSVQFEPAVGPDGAGGFVVVWQSKFILGDFGYSIAGQRYDGAGTPVGTQFHVNTYTPNDQFEPDVADDGAGGFVVVWTSFGSSGTDSCPNCFESVQGQRYDSAGTPVGGEFQVNTTIGYTQNSPAVAPNGAGGFAVVWQSSLSSGTDTDLTSIQGQRYDSAGTLIGSEFQVNASTLGDQVDPAVAPVPGGFAVAWHDVPPGKIEVEFFDSTGTPQLGGFPVNTYDGNSTAIALVDPGTFAVTWASSGSTGTDASDRSIQGRLFFESESTTTSTTLPTPTTTLPTTTSTSSTTTSTIISAACPPAPQNGCQPSQSQKGVLLLKKGPTNSGDMLKWKWKSSASSPKTDFGTPLATTGYRLCLYDFNGHRFTFAAPAAGTCDGKPCWTDKATGFKYKDKDLKPNGLLIVLLKAGDEAGKGKVIVKGKGPQLGLPTSLSLPTPVRVQLQRNDVATPCWDATFSAPAVSDNFLFSGKSD
jgi:hypothetical protein